ncbi:MAG: TRAP transporter TatT component family protein [Acidobacteria bacterium]|nr:TRAP transporter TatT component family protein [Acidobacteriota bacterium]
MRIYSRDGKSMRLMLYAILILLIFPGCSIKKIAINKLGDALAQSGTTFSSDNDPDLVADALPFSLKLIESLLAESPRHRGLLFAASSGFTQYAYAFIRQEADETESEDLARALELRRRARNLFLRARDYGVRGLETHHPGFGEALNKDPQLAVQQAKAADVPLLYWTAASWGLAITLSKNEPDLIVDQPVVEALVDRALQLNEAFEEGAIHSFLISYEPVRQGVSGDPLERARKHFDRAVELSKGYQAGPLVSMAESVCIAEQNRQEFQSLLDRALAVDVNAKPQYRLANLVMQRRARWLLSRIDELFLTLEPE